MKTLSTTVRAAALALGLLAFGVPASAQNYEIWAADQGTNVVHVYNQDLKEVAKIDLGALGTRVPHMIDFTSDGAYAFVASTGSGDVTVIRASDRQIVQVFKTGGRTHMANVTPDDRMVIADVMGDPKEPRSGKLVEITIDKAGGKFAMGRSLTIAEDPVFKAQSARFKDTAVICHDYTADGRFAYVTLGADLPNGGLLVLDTQSFKLVKAIGPDQLQVNCGTMLTPDKRHMIVNGGDANTGVWYALNTQTHDIVREGKSGGNDAHGVMNTPNGKEIWMVNRVSSNGMVLNADTLEVIAGLADVGPTPDIIAMSPDSKFAFITLRGPNPMSAPHLAKGTTPGFSVIDVATRKKVRTVEPAQGNPRSDFHGIAVRMLK